jgi:hypothetical protein
MIVSLYLNIMGCLQGVPASELQCAVLPAWQRGLGTVAMLHVVQAAETSWPVSTNTRFFTEKLCTQPTADTYYLQLPGAVVCWQKLPLLGSCPYLIVFTPVLTMLGVYSM